MSRLFISYSHSDSRFVKELREHLGQLNPDFEIWLDTEDLYGGVTWSKEILAAVAASDVFLYVLSDESIKSPYCQQEYEKAKESGKPIITILARRLSIQIDELSAIQHIDMINGVDARAISRLNASIVRQLKLVENKAPLTPKRTTKPVTQLTQEKNQSKLANYIAIIGIMVAAIVGIVAAIITIMPYFWERWDKEATQTAVALISTHTPNPIETTSRTSFPSGTASLTTEPSPTYTAIITPSDTPQPSNTASVCLARIKSSDGSQILNIVYEAHNVQAAKQNSVEANQQIQILDKYVNGYEIWYEIYDMTNQRLGWIMESYLSFDSACVFNED